MDNHTQFMELALGEAKKALDYGDVPVGAVIVKEGKVIAKAHNMREKNQVSTHHAEILAIEKACEKLGSWHLDGCSIYVTLEPCPMCAGAIINSRIGDVYFGAKEHKTGSVGSVINLFALDYTFTPRIHYGILENECKSLLKDFFEKLRK